jgi:hypothetical protein
MFVARVTSVEHRLFVYRVRPEAYPSVGVTKVAPSVKTQFLLNGAFRVGYRRPAAEVVLQDVVQIVLAVGVGLNYGESFGIGFSRFLMKPHRIHISARFAGKDNA